MKLVEFDRGGFCDEVAKRIEFAGRGARRRMMKATGIPEATFSRMVDGRAVRSIDTILAAAAYWKISLAPFVRIAQ